MKALNNIQRIYFIGIGGIGMSALARYFNARNIAVGGYDKTETALTRQLVKEGISINYVDDTLLADQQADLVVITPAVPKDHKQLNFYRENDFNIAKRSDVLGEITKNSFNVCVAGTHGKTTSSSMIGHILRHSGYGCTAFLGGIAVNYDNNFWATQSALGDKNVSVVEADEYDRSFLKLCPDMAIISSMDADHLDIYGTAENMQQAFIDFTSLIKPGGFLLSKYGLQRSQDLVADNHLTYHLDNKAADVFASDIKAEDGSYFFNINIQNEVIDGLQLNMGGLHNIENAIAAITIAHRLGIEKEKIQAAVSSFKGVKRRFEYILKNDGQVFIDDYAHHPNELSALIGGAKKLFTGKRCSVIFQPHLYSRTRDLAEAFATALDMADDVILLPIYPARELPMEGVSSQMIKDKMKKTDVKIFEKEAILNWVEQSKPNFLITAGAGDIDTLVGPIKVILTNK